MEEWKNEPDMQKGKQTVECSTCGSRWQKGYECLATNVTCSRCAQLGHFTCSCCMEISDATGDDKILRQPDNSKAQCYRSSDAHPKVGKMRGPTINTAPNFEGDKRTGTNSTAAEDPPPEPDKFSNHAKENVHRQQRKTKDDNNNNKNNNNKNKENFRNWRSANDRSTFASAKRNAPSFSEAEEMKEKANALYYSGQYDLALEEYTKLIDCFPRSEIFYNNRSACFMIMGDLWSALVDARKCIYINSRFLKGHYRVIKCLMALGRTLELKNRLLDLETINPTDEVLIEQRKKFDDLHKYVQLEAEARAAKDNATALKYVEKCVELCPHCEIYKLRKAQHLVFLERYEEADAIANDILVRDKANINAKYILSIHIYQNDLTRAVKYLEEMLQEAPDCVKAKILYEKAKRLLDLKERGNEAYRRGDYKTALALYCEAMKIDRRNKKAASQLLYNKAQAYFKMGWKRQAIVKCTEALETDRNYVKALLRRGICYMDEREYGKAVDDFEKCCELNARGECRELLSEAKRKLLQELKEELKEKRKADEEVRRKEEEQRRKEQEKKRSEEEYNRWKKEYDERQKEKFHSGYEQYQQNGEGNFSFTYFRTGDLYGVLGLTHHASMEEVTAAYKRQAKLHHPDRHANSPLEVRDEHENKMKLVTEAYREIRDCRNGI